jgi:hypothetical protein
MTYSRRGGTKLLNRAGASGREARVIAARLASEAKGDTCYGSVSPFYLTEQKRLPIEYSPRDNLSYPIFIPKLSTHRMHDPGSNVSYIRPKVLTDNQMS